MRRGPVLFLAFSAAVFLAVYLLPPAALPWAALGLVLLFPLALWRRRRLGALALAALAFGLLWSWGYRALVFAPAEALSGRRTQIQLVLADYPTPTDYGAQAEGYLLSASLPVKTRFYGPETLLELSPGDRIAVTADCSRSDVRRGVETRTNTSKGVYLLATARGEMSVTPAGGVPWWCLPSQWARALRRGIAAAFPEDVSPLVAGVVTGARDFPDGFRVDLSRTGASHIVAVSGMHICFLIGLLTRLTGWRPRRRAAVCIPVVVLFALMAGATPSVLRAALMQLILLVAPLVRREADGLTSLSFALAALLLLNPFSAADVGLQLSFLAVVGIRVITPRVSRCLMALAPRGDSLPLRLVRRLLRFIWTTLSTTLGAMAFTVPLTYFYFETFSLAAPLVNLLILPAVSVLFAGGLLLGLLGIGLPGLAAWPGALLAWLGRYVAGVVSAVARFPYAAVTVSDVYYPALVAAVYALLLVALLWRGERRRPWVFLVSGAVMALAAILFTALVPLRSPLTVAVLDVGQGQSVALTSRGRAALIDCGGSSLTDPGDVAANYFQDRGITRLDLLVLTHFHDDHANGLAALFRRMDVRAVAIPDTDRDSRCRGLLLELCEAAGTDVRFVDRDTVKVLGEAALTLYAPLGDGGANEEGLSVLVTEGDFDVLITGDMNTVVEERLVKYGRLPDCEVLVVGHHGSRYATGVPLLDAAAPETAVISVGPNTYGHPAQETLLRLESRDIAIYRTDLQGTVTLQVH